MFFIDKLLRNIMTYVFSFYEAKSKIKVFTFIFVIKLYLRIPNTLLVKIIQGNFLIHLKHNKHTIIEYLIIFYSET